VNNALFVSGRDFLAEIERLGTGGWMELEEIIPVPADAAGTFSSDPVGTFPSDATGIFPANAPETIPPDPAGASPQYESLLPADPAPFNHATKIAVLRVRREVLRTLRKG